MTAATVVLWTIALVAVVTCAQQDGSSRSTATSVDTVFAEGFESGTLRAWHDGTDPSRHRILGDPAVAHSGNHVLEVTYPAGRDGGWLTHWFMPGYDSLHVTFWVRLAPDWQGGTKLLALYGSRTDDKWSAMGQAGRCPDGTDFFAAMVVTEPSGEPGPLRFYSYYPAMAREPDGVTCWGRYGDGSESYAPELFLRPGTWHQVEFWVKLNTPGRADGRQALWVDGVPRGHWGGLSFRDSAILRLNSVQLTFSVAGPGAPWTQRLYIDELVVGAGRP